MRSNQEGGTAGGGQLITWYYVVVLGLANAVSFIDRSFLSLVLDPVRKTFGATDTQMGLLIGPSFMLFYSLVALPIGAWADRYNRKRIILAGLFCWTLCTGLFGIARNFMLLAAARMGVGLGEATLTPSAVSIISDYFPRSYLGRAIAVFTGLGTLGSSLAFIFGGWLMHHLTGVGAVSLPIVGLLEPWQAAFLVISLPGFVLWAVMALTLREPARKGVGGRPPTAAGSWVDTIRYMRTYPLATVTLILGFSVISAGSAGGSWMPTFFGRTYGWEPAQIGPYLGALNLCVGVTGILAGGFLGDFLRRSGREDANVRAAIYALLIVLPCDLLIPNVGNPYVSLALMAPANFCTMLCFGLATPALPLVVPASMRSKTVALYLLGGNLVGAGLGPVIIPLFTDYVFRDPAALRYSLTIVPGLLFPVSIGLLVISRKPFMRRVQELKASEDGVVFRPET